MGEKKAIHLFRTLATDTNQCITNFGINTLERRMSCLIFSSVALCVKVKVTRSNVCNAVKSMKLGSDRGAVVELAYWELNIPLAHYHSSGST